MIFLTHGILLVLQELELTILQISSNTQSIFGMSPENVIDQPLDDFLDSFQLESIRSGLAEETLDFINPTKIWIRKAGDDYAVFDGIFHRNSEGFLILELEPAVDRESIPFLSFYHLARVEGEGEVREKFCIANLYFLNFLFSPFRMEKWKEGETKTLCR